MTEHSYDNFPRIRTTKIRGVSFTTAAVAAAATKVLFRPQLGRRFIVDRVVTTVRDTAGTISSAPTATIDNGTNGQDIVADTTVTGAVGAVKRHTVIQNNLLVTNATPLRMRKTGAATGATKHLLDVAVVMTEL